MHGIVHLAYACELLRLSKIRDEIPLRREECKTRENSNFLKKGKTVISIKIQNFSRSRMTKRTSPFESSHEI